MSALTYDGYVTAMAELIVCSTNDSAFLAVLPSVINDAEQRIYRELDYLDTITVSSATMASSTRTITLPSTVTYVVVQDINYVDTNGSRTPLIRVSRETVDMMYPTATSSSTSAVPIYYGMVTDQQPVFGPPPGQDISLEIVGTVRPTALSSGNTTTYISNYYPDLMIAASMVFANGYLKNFSAMGDDPQAPITWEKHYQTLAQSAILEEARKKGESEGWTSKQPSPAARRKG